MSLPWIRKYEPEKAKDIFGQDVPLARLRAFIEHVQASKRKGVIIHGPNGCGKTVSVYAIAHELDLEVLEVNASDFRNKDKINAVLGNALHQRSLFGRGKVILVDEVDGLSGQKDRGGMAALAALLDRSPYPLVMTCADPYIRQLKGVKKKSELITFQPLDYLTLFSLLKKIADKEGFSYEETALKSLARMAGGDARAAINDLQTVHAFQKKVDRKSLEVLGERDSHESIKDVLIRIFKTTDADIARAALWNVKENIDEVMLWIDENLPKEYRKPDDLSRAYDRLSRADVFRGRIRRWQHWGYLVYMNALLSAGIATAKDARYPSFTSFTQTRRLLKLWMANQKYLKKKSIAAKIGQHTHSSTTYALQHAVPYFRQMFRHDKEGTALMAQELDLVQEEIDWLQK
ncbi:MAG: replication factor C large subunit [DPANN group archaeon]|nr:replication factor C large subunit [DPANN group archaeon]